MIRAITTRIESVNGINLGQGACRLPIHQVLADAASAAIQQNKNGYTACEGVSSLRDAIAQRVRQYNHIDVGPKNILVTSGATGALECVCKCLIEPNDEVVMFSPYYQYHIFTVLDCGGVLRFVQLQPPSWELDLKQFEMALTPRTKLVLFSNPCNPTGRVFSLGELTAIASLCNERKIRVVVDEVYEYIVNKPHEHISLAALPEAGSNVFTISSASKTFFVTGWRVGWVIGADESEIAILSLKSDRTYVCAPAPLQYAIDAGLRLDQSFFDGIGRIFTPKRDQLCQALSEARLHPLVPEGAYYVLADYSNLGYPDDHTAMNGLVSLAGIGSVPGSAFVADDKRTGFLRFCFALPDSQLDRACELLTLQPLDFSEI